METQKVEFDFDKRGIIQNLSERQASGELKKPFKELRQNSKDACATIFKVWLTKRCMKVYDNGNGMSFDEIMTRFRIIGYRGKSGDENSDGEFGVGRFQFFNEGIIYWFTRGSDDKLWLIHVDIKKNLTNFEITEIEFGEHTLVFPDGRTKKIMITEDFTGTIIYILFYKEIQYNFKIDYALDDFREAVLPTNSMKIFFNDEEYNPEIIIDEKLSDENFDVFSMNNITRQIYANGIHVRQNTKTSFDYNINCKMKMRLNFARNEFVKRDEDGSINERTKMLYDKIAEIETHYIKTQKDFNTTQCAKILKLIETKEIDIKEIIDKPLIPQTDGNYYTFNEIKNKSILFGEKDIWSDDCIQQGYAVIPTNFRERIISINKREELELNFPNRSIRNIAHTGYHNKISPKQLRKQINYLVALEVNYKIFNSKRNLDVGISDIAEAWTDGYYEITIDKSVIDGYSNIPSAVLGIWAILSHEYSHDDSTIKQDYHNVRFYEKYHRLTQKTVKKIPGLLSNITTKKLKERWGHRL